jgi:hypothetical protein
MQKHHTEAEHEQELKRTERASRNIRITARRRSAHENKNLTGNVKCEPGRRTEENLTRARGPRKNLLAGESSSNNRTRPKEPAPDQNATEEKSSGDLGARLAARNEARVGILPGTRLTCTKEIAQREPESAAKTESCTRRPTPGDEEKILMNSCWEAVPEREIDFLPREPRPGSRDEGTSRDA